MEGNLPPPPSASPPGLDPPFRGYIETTFDALLVFEAARRGMIPRVTRRLIERERGMVQSGAVFVFDEHESGIKRWTDGLVWSPSRILGNFLVYRETDKRSNQASIPISSNANASPSQTSPSSVGLHRPPYAESGTSSVSPNGTGPSGSGGGLPVNGDIPPLGGGALRQRSTSDGGMDRQRERQLVGSLTNSYKFKDGGLVKKTMSVTVNGFAQHMVSYYTIADVMSGRLRCPSTVPELASLEISPEYLHKQNFRFPPMIEVGPDGIPRYRGEPEEPTSPTTAHNMSLTYSSNGSDMYEYAQIPQPLRLDTAGSSTSSTARNRSITVPMPIPLPSPAHSIGSYAPPGSAGSGYFGGEPMSPMGQSSMRPGTASSASANGAVRPSSSRGRYDPYSATSPRSGSMSLQQQQQQRRMSLAAQPPHEPAPVAAYYTYDVKPVQAPNGQYHYPDYSSYHAGNGASSAAGSYHSMPSPMTSPTYPAGQYPSWQQQQQQQQQQQTPSSSRLGLAIPRAGGTSPIMQGHTQGEMQPPPNPHASLHGQRISGAASGSPSMAGSGSPTHADATSYASVNGNGSSHSHGHGHGSAGGSGSNSTPGSGTMPGQDWPIQGNGNGTDNGNGGASGGLAAPAPATTVTGWDPTTGPLPIPINPSQSQMHGISPEHVLSPTQFHGHPGYAHPHSQPHAHAQVGVGVPVQDWRGGARMAL